MIENKATFAGGCFWCTEAIFKRLKGVSEVVSGFTGGEMENPSYEKVVGGDTGHAEAIQITYDPEIISYPQLLEVFWATHDPTTPDRQGNDIGSQYRSVIFYHDLEQKQLAEQSKEKLEDSGKYTDEIITTIERLQKFYPAEEDHQNFYDQNQSYPYCQVIIDPKLQKLYREFGDKVKEEFKNT